MKKEKNSLKGPLGFIACVVMAELILALLAIERLWWAAVCLFVLVAGIQATTLLLLWYVFRLLVKALHRLKNLEKADVKQ